VKRNRILTDTAFGVAFGFLFPIVATLLELNITQEPVNFTGVLTVQAANPLLWIIDSAPLFLGLFAYMVGIRAARIDRINATLAQSNRERSQMIEQLENLRVNLERKVIKQVTQLKATAQVGRAAASIHDQKQLLGEVVGLISSQFGFYHAGIFLIDEAGEFAMLQAANSEGGKRMLANGHKLPVGKVGIVGFVADKGLPRIALDVGNDATFFNNPDLPLTRSEIALPLKTSGEIIGVLDVQSTEASAFADEDVEVMQLMADQVALAIQNVRLIEESRHAVQELENLYKEQVRQDWNRKLGSKPQAFKYNRLGVEPVSAEQLAITSAEMEPNQLEIPLLLRGELLGTILLRRDKNQPAWTTDERSLAEEAAGQVTAALENARLFEEAQSRVARERALSQMTSQFTRAINLDTLLKKAAQELGQLPDVAEVTIQIGADQNGS
jgi:GAF domain-containing protein